MFRIPELENPDDVLILPQNAIELGKLAAISRDSYITVNIEPDRHWLRSRNGLKQFCQKIVGDRKIVFGDVVLRYLHNNHTRIRRLRPYSPSKRFIADQKLRGPQQPKFTRACDKREYADGDDKTRDSWVAKCSPEPRRQLAYSQLPMIR